MPKKRALVLDFYKTSVDGKRLDSFLGEHVDKAKAGEKFYDLGGKAALEALNAGKKGVEGKVKDLFYPGIQDLYQTATEQGIDVYVYSNGHGPFIKSAFRRHGMEVRFLNPQRVGSKKDAKSYHGLTRHTGAKKEDIIFLTDSKAEVKAATEAGIKTYLHNPDNPSYDKVKDHISSKYKKAA